MKTKWIGLTGIFIAGVLAVGGCFVFIGGHPKLHPVIGNGGKSVYLEPGTYKTISDAPKTVPCDVGVYFGSKLAFHSKVMLPTDERERAMTATAFNLEKLEAMGSIPNNYWSAWTCPDQDGELTKFYGSKDNLPDPFVSHPSASLAQ